MACHGGRGVCQMIILLYKIYSGHLGGEGQNIQKMATWFKDDPLHQHIITCSCIQFLPTFMNIKHHKKGITNKYTIYNSNGYKHARKSDCSCPKGQMTNMPMPTFEKIKYPFAHAHRLPTRSTSDST